MRPVDYRVAFSMDQLKQIEFTHHELDRARLMLALAIGCDMPREFEHRRMLLDAAEEALSPAFAALTKLLRGFHLRLRALRENRNRMGAAQGRPHRR